MALGFLTQRFQDAATQAENASTKMHQVVHGTALETVTTESGPVPTLLKWFADLNDQTSGAVGAVDARLTELEEAAVRKLQIKQEAGDSESNVMSQAIVSSLIAALSNTQNLESERLSLIGAGLLKVDQSKPCIIKTGPNTVSVKAGTVISTSAGVMATNADTAVVMPGTLSMGENYGVWAQLNGTIVAVLAPNDAGPYNWGTEPSTGAKLLGGFHYSLTAAGTTVAGGGFAATGFTNVGGNFPWTQGRVDQIAGVNEFSIWDLTFRPKKFGIKGLIYDQEAQFWGGGYLLGTDHLNDGPSKAGTNVASGTVLPKIPLAYGGNGTNTYGRLSWYEANEIAQSHGCRLLEQNEFNSAALGVTEGQSLGGPASTIPLTLRQPGYTSRLGMEQMTGHIYTWGATCHGVAGSAWVGGPNRGNNYGTPYAALFGGARDNAAYSGSRAVNWHNAPWSSEWVVGLRVACDHLSLA